MIAGFEETQFQPSGSSISHTLYTRGTGPGVVLIHELPGLTKPCVKLANRLVDAGYRVYMPLMFGKPESAAMFKNLMHVCISREFYCFANNKTSPIVSWIKEICKKAHDECGGPGVGAIGMCLTGNFVISLMAEPWMLAPVACQPSLPFSIPKLTPKKAAALAVTPDELEKAVARGNAGQPLMCLRFKTDSISPQARFDNLRNTFGRAFIDGEIDPDKETQYTFPKKAHSVLTAHFVNKTGHPTQRALDNVLAFFEDRLSLSNPQ